MPTVSMCSVDTYRAAFEIFKCPADTGDVLIGLDKTPFWKGLYGFYSSWAWPAGYVWVNGLPEDNPCPATGPRGASDLLRLSKRPVVFDHRPWHWGTAGNSWTNIPGKNTVLFCDGHAGVSDHNTMLAIMYGTPPPGY